MAVLALGLAPLLVAGTAVAAHPAAASGATGRIQGRVTDAASGTPIGTRSASVALYAPGGVLVAAHQLSPAGTYSFAGLTPGVAYVPCYVGGDSSAYQQPTCRGDVPFTGGLTDPAPGAKPVRVAAGQVKRGVNIASPQGGQITGVLSVSGGHAFAYNTVAEVFDPSGALARRQVLTFTEFEIDGLPASADGYRVCFDPRGSTRTDLAPICYRSAAWSGDASELPSTAKPVVVADLTSTKANTTLPLASG